MLHDPKVEGGTSPTFGQGTHGRDPQTNEGRVQKVAKDNVPSESIVQASCWNTNPNTLAGPLLCCSDRFKVKAMRKNQYCVSGSAL